MSEWVKLVLHKAAYLENGVTPYFSGATKYLATADVVGYSKEPSEEVSYASRPSRAQIYLEVGDVLQAKMRETNKSFVVDFETAGWLASTGFARFKPLKVGNSPTYISYVLSSDLFLRQRDRLCVGSTQQAISDRDLKSITVKIPRVVRMQDEIARILQTIDQAIAKTEALIDKYQQVKDGLMHDLFTRGIGPDGQLRPTREQAPELYQETPVGWIPKEWEFASIGEYVISAQYGISTSLDDKASGIPVLRMNNIQSNSFDVSDLKYSRDPEAYTIKLSSGDVLYNRTNSIEHVGKTAIWKDELAECSFASYLVRLNLIKERLLPEYFSHWVSQVSSQNALRVYATPGVQQVNINPTNLQRVMISLPSCMNEQLEVTRRVDAVGRRIEEEKLLQSKLQKQKTGLMHDLLTGKVLVQAEPEGEPEAAHV